MIRLIIFSKDKLTKSKKWTKIILLLFISLIFCTKAEEGYEIKNYNIDIVVNKNNSFDITEEIYTDFYQEKHGIIRTLPIVNTVRRLDKTTSQNVAKLSNVWSNMPYDVSENRYNYEIKIGDADNTIIGENLIIIKYTYSIGNDPLEDNDEFYYNLIGTDWHVPIRNVSFKIHFPEERIKDVGFSSGYLGSTINNDIEWKFSDNKTIVGKTTKELSPQEGITIRVTLSEGYFNKRVDIKSIISIIALLIVGAIAIWIYIKDKNSIVDTVEFYPPDGFNGMDCETLLSNNIGYGPVMSLIFTLANKGCITIKDNDIGYEIHKIKDYNENNEEEKIFMESLFRYKNDITDEDISYGWFCDLVSNIRHQEVNKITSNFKNPNYSVMGYMILMSLILLIISITQTTRINILLAILIIITFNTMFYFLNARNIVGRGAILYELLLYPFCYILLLTTYGALLPLTIMAMIIELLSIIIGVMILYFASIHSKYNDEYLILKGRVLGFKNFLITARKDELEALVEDNPNYFYDILPYTMAMNISDVWVAKFKYTHITIPEAEWYEGKDIIDTGYKIGTVSNYNSSSLDHSYFDLSDSGSFGISDSGGSNGGFSGGGSGGGGGRSW